jgi:hypothetical protein
VDVTVTTPTGTSAVVPVDKLTYEANPPACINYTGTGFSTALFSS